MTNVELPDEQITASEEKRLKTLYSYKILDTLPDKEFDNLTQLASEIAGTKVAMINLIDDERQWAKSTFGTSNQLKEMLRENSVCQYTIKSSGVTEIKNLLEDKRFSDFDYVKAEDGFRYYFGVPLIAQNNHTIGSLCVLDYQEKNLSETQIRQLKIISNQVMAHLELHKQNKELRELNEYKVKLMKMLSHDMRSPLNGIIGLSGMLKEMNISGNEEHLELLDIIEQSSTQLNQMINEVMSYAIIESDGLQLDKSETDLEKTIRDISKLYKPAARIKDIHLEFYTEHLEEPVFLDGDKFEQILGNLLSNAIKYTKPGGSVWVSLIRPEQYDTNIIELSVSDSGIGMDEEELADLFVEKKSKAVSKGTGGEKSSGIGLTIVDHFVNLFSGTIEVDSEPGKGTTFTVKIPIAEPSETPA